MIDENTTFALFGYYPSELRPKSNKKIVVICNKCGKIREVYRYGYSNLCISCAKKDDKNPMRNPEVAKKNGDTKKGKKLSDDCKKKMSENNAMKNSENCRNQHSKSMKIHYLNQRWNIQVDNFINGIPIMDFIERPVNGYGVLKKDYDIWRHAVYKRDYHTCRICGKNNCEVQAHHIIPQRINQDLILDVNNGITMCKTCHESIYGKEKLFIEELQMIINNKI